MRITHADLLLRFYHDPYTGRFYSRKSGRECGTLHKSRAGVYRRTTIDNKKYMDHVLAWFYHTGEWPTHQVDHRNRDTLDNAWSNLRESTQGFNNFNKSVYKNNRLGVRGVTRVKSGAYVAKIKKDKKTYHLGSFSTLHQAVAAREAAEIRHWGMKADDHHNGGSDCRQRQSEQHSAHNDAPTLPARHSFGIADTSGVQSKRFIVTGDPG